MHPILLKVQAYLDKVNREAADMSPEIIEEAVSAFRDTLNKHFNETRGNFTLRMSNVGRPLCQLKMEKDKVEKEPAPYSLAMKLLFGDMIEIAAVAIMKAAGINVKEFKDPVKLGSIKGTPDVDIDNVIWDIKSCSPWVWKHKFSRGYKTVAASDGFGYVLQGKAYSMATNKPFGGWIAIEKVTGEWTICEATNLPDDKKITEEIAKKVKALNGEPFKRCFTDEAETFRKSETGNKVLGFECSWCDYKWSCWPELKRMPSIPSTAKEPKFVYYTHVKEKEKDDEDVQSGDQS